MTGAGHLSGVWCTDCKVAKTYVFILGRPKGCSGLGSHGWDWLKLDKRIVTALWKLGSSAEAESFCTVRAKATAPARFHGKLLRSELLGLQK